MARTDKSAAIAELKEKFENSSAILLTEYRGLTVAAMQTLRRSLGANAEYKVAKNTLTAIAAKQAGVEGLDDALAGPTAIAFVTGEVSEGTVLSAGDVAKFADLESREVLLAKAAGVLKAALFQAAYVFQAPVSKTVRTIDALRAKEEAAA